MLQLHDVAEFFEKRSGQNPLVENILRAALNNNVACFDFGNPEDISKDARSSLVDYACELASHSMFKLPYQIVYYSYSGETAHEGILVEQISDTELSFCVFNAVKKPTKVGIVISGQARLTMGKDSSDGQKDFYVRSKQLFIHEDAKPRYDDIELKMTTAATNYTLMFTALLMSTHTRTRENSIGIKLNQKREKRGLLPIMPYHTVYFEADGKRYNMDGTEHGGTHASPRMHWRRGHIRKFESGKIAHVRPCLVGSIGTSAQVLKPKYEMRAS